MDYCYIDIIVHNIIFLIIKYNKLLLFVLNNEKLELFWNLFEFYKNYKNLDFFFNFWNVYNFENIGNFEDF